MRSHSAALLLAAAAALLLAGAQLAAEAQLFGSSSSSSSSSSSASVSISTSGATAAGAAGPAIKLRPNRIRRPEFCRENLPRKADDLPALVVTARVKEVYLAGGQQEQAGANSSAAETAGGPQQGATNKALVTIERVIRGNRQLTGADILVSGFNSSTAAPCPNFVVPNDTLIFLLNQEQANKRYSIQASNLLSMNLNNLDRINAIAADEPYKRRPNIDDILCEAHYCAYGRCVANERGHTSCHCPDSCPPLPAPVCGSDNTTYTNECHLIKEGCRRQRPLFVTKESVC